LAAASLAEAVPSRSAARPVPRCRGARPAAWPSRLNAFLSRVQVLEGQKRPHCAPPSTCTPFCGPQSASSTCKYLRRLSLPELSRRPHERPRTATVFVTEVTHLPPPSRLGSAAGAVMKK
jgi:hypothetical protein